MSGNHPAIATMGHTSQSAAIRALHCGGFSAREIAGLTGTSMNNVNRTICDYRKANGIKPVPKQRIKVVHDAEPSHPMWYASEEDRRAAIHAKAVKGARKALRQASL